MRRSRQQLPQEQAARILSEATSGVLSLTGIDGEPYGVPVSHVCDGKGHIYIHSARRGHKIDCVRADSRCSFCVVEQDTIVPEEFTTYFRSVIVRGRLTILTDEEEIREALRLLCARFSPGIDPTAEIERCISHVSVLRLDILSATGKESIELVTGKGSR